MTAAALIQPVPSDDRLTEAVAAQYLFDVWDLRVFGYSNTQGRWARFCGRADRARRGATDITQPWLLGVAKQWVLRAALRSVSPAYLDDVILSLTLLSSTLRERADQGNRPGSLERADLTAHLIRLGHLREADKLTLKGQQRSVRYLARVLEDAMAWGLTEAGAIADGLPSTFTVHRHDLPAGRTRGIDAPSKALPRGVVRQLLEPEALARLADLAGTWSVNLFILALGTGRRPGEICNLPLDSCLDHNVYRDEHGLERTHAVLVHDMTKVAITGYRLPIGADMAAVIEKQRRHVLEVHPSTDPSLLPLFPAPHHNPDGTKAVAVWTMAVVLRRWVDSFPELWSPDADEEGRVAADPMPASAPGSDAATSSRRPFPRDKIYLYALRHTWAQDHADNGTTLEVLQDLLGHSKPTTTQLYYRLTPTRRRDAVIRLSRLQLTNSGSLVSAGVRVLEAEDGMRTQIGSAAVPFGICVEPVNVKSGGHSCPYRMRCLGCSHFRTDPSYLPELREYLSELLTSRERIAAATSSDLEPWARHSAMPPDEEVERVRHLVRRCESSLDTLTSDEHAEINRCIGQVRMARARVTAAVPIDVRGVVRHGEPSVFPSTFERLRSQSAQAPTGVVR